MTNNTPPISVFIADAQYLIRLGLRQLLTEKEGFEIMGEAGDEEQLLHALNTQQPQVITLDYDQAGKFSQSTILKIKEQTPSANILIISADDNRQNIYKVVESGINSFLTKHCDAQEIVSAVAATAKGEKFFCHNVLNHILEKSFGKEEDCTPTPLTPREVEVVQLIAQGLIAKEIGHKLHLSTHTIYTHRKNIMKKLKISSTSELVLYAVDQGWIE